MNDEITCVAIGILWGRMYLDKTDTESKEQMLIILATLHALKAEIPEGDENTLGLVAQGMEIVDQLPILFIEPPENVLLGMKSAEKTLEEEGRTSALELGRTNRKAFELFIEWSKRIKLPPMPTKH